jgi:hypothetical protein
MERAAVPIRSYQRVKETPVFRNGIELTYIMQTLVLSAKKKLPFW